jgi:hypothetical protein
MPWVITGYDDDGEPIASWVDDPVVTPEPITEPVVAPAPVVVNPPADDRADPPSQVINPGQIDNPSVPGQGWQQDEVGNWYKLDSSGNLTFKNSTGTDFTYDDKKGGFVDSKGNFAGEGPASFLNKLGKDGINKLKQLFSDGKGGTDWTKLLSLAGGAYAASQPNRAAPTGYQGKIPNYTAERQMLTAPPADSRSGAYGIDYGGDVTYKDEAGKLIGKQARGINDLREMALMDQQSSYGPIQRMVADRAAYWDTKPVGSDFGVAGGVLTRTGDNTATFTDADGKTYQMNRGESFADTAANIPAFAKAWQENYGYKTQGDGIRGLLKPSPTAPVNDSAIGNITDPATTPITGGGIGGASGGANIQFPRPEGRTGIPDEPTAHIGRSSRQKSTGPDKEFDLNNLPGDYRFTDPVDMMYRGPAPQAKPGEIIYKKGGIAGGLKPEGFVVPADVVSHFGNGSSEAGLKLLASRLGAEPIKGEGDGMSDSIRTTIGGKQEARVANDEAFISPEMVKRIGGGSAKKGAQKLYAMMDRVREERTGTKEQGKQIDPERFMPGGSVQRYAPGGTTDPKIPTGVTGSESSLSNWAGDYVTGLIGRGSALAKTPYQAYTGQLTAGTSGLQQQAFDMASGKTSSGISNALTGLAGYSPSGGGGATATNVSSSYTAPGAYKPGQFTTGTFGTEQAQQYMNPYLKSALDPQMEEARRQADISRMADAGRLTQAGAFGGSRQAIMESEGRRNLMDKQNQMLTSGYSTAYDKAMQQFNADQQRALDVQKAQEQAGQFGYGQTADQAKTAADLALRAGTANQSAGLTAAQINSSAATAADTNRLNAMLGMGNLGLNQINQLSTLGGMQRGIESEGIAAKRAQFEEARMNPYKMIQYEQSLLSGMPLSAQSYSMPGTSNAQQFSQGATTVQQLLDILNGRTAPRTN